MQIIGTKDKWSNPNLLGERKRRSRVNNYWLKIRLRPPCGQYAGPRSMIVMLSSLSLNPMLHQKQQALLPLRPLCQAMVQMSHDDVISSVYPNETGRNTWYKSPTCLEAFVFHYVTESYRNLFRHPNIWHALRLLPARRSSRLEL